MTKEEMAIREDIITLCAGHSMLYGNVPKYLNENLLSEKFFEKTSVKENLGSYGLFSLGVDYKSFADDAAKVEEEDWTKAEYIEPMYRLLSEVIVNKGWNPVDFSMNGVLKNSMALLLGQTVYTDHYSSTRNAIGSIKNTVWQEAYQDTFKGKKIIIPAGIVGTFKIDALSNPKIARGIMMDPPSIHSNSVTIKFKWDKSHPNMDDRDFWGKLGSYGADGSMIRKVAVDIRSYDETSLVSNGADPFAKKLDKNGKIVLPGTATSNYESYSEQNYHSNRYYFTDFKSLAKEEVLHNTTVIFNDNITSPSTEESKNHNKNNNSMEELQKFLDSIFGKDLLSLKEGETATSEIALSQIQSVLKEVNRLKEIETKYNDLQPKYQALQDKESFIAVGETHLSEMRESVKADYVKLSGGEEKTEAAILAVFAGADLKTLQGFKNTYAAQLEEKYPMCCNKCGSKEVSRSSAVSTDDDDQGDGNTRDQFKAKSTSEAREALYKKSIG